MNEIKKLLYISDISKTKLRKAVFASVISNILFMIPVIVSIEVFVEILKPLSGQEIRFNRIWMLFIVGIIVFVLMFLASIYEHRKCFVASYSESESYRIKISEHLRHLPMSFFNTRDLAEITTNIMGDCASIEMVLSHTLPQIIATGISTTIISICLLIIDWRLALCVIITIPTAMFIIWASRKIHKKWVRKLTNLKLEQEEAIQEYIEGIKVIKSCRVSKNNFQHINKLLASMKNMQLKGEIITGLFFTGAQIILQWGTGITIFVGAMLYANGHVKCIPVLLFCMLSIRIYGPILVQIVSFAELMYYRFATERMRKLMLIPTITGDETKQFSDFNIHVQNVSFAYADKIIIDNVTIPFCTNQITAIVGPSGSGKSTLIKLIARFWDINQGNILIGNNDISKIKPEHLMKYISIVFQDVILFNDTIYNNIKIGNKNASEQEIYEAAKLAGCEDFIKDLPDKYNTLLGENGSKLSGGERQRISIARALLKDAPIVILDEATSSLDSENENLVQQGISKLIKGKTVIVIAHKLRTIENADKIVVLSNGKVEEMGKHKELLKNNGLYKKLYDLQDMSSTWSVNI
ncbi:ABC transporter ATP-binding protein [Vallitalea sediminicola]